MNPILANEPTGAPSRGFMGDLIDDAFKRYALEQSLFDEFSRKSLLGQLWFLFRARAKRQLLERNQEQLLETIQLQAECAILTDKLVRLRRQIAAAEQFLKNLDKAEGARAREIIGGIN